MQRAIGKGGTKARWPRLQAIADQTKPVTVVVRVAEGADDAATTTNLIGASDAAASTPV